jgi:hypothetical protein
MMKLMMMMAAKMMMMAAKPQAPLAGLWHAAASCKPLILTIAFWSERMIDVSGRVLLAR